MEYGTSGGFEGFQIDCNESEWPPCSFRLILEPQCSCATLFRTLALIAEQLMTNSLNLLMVPTKMSIQAWAFQT